MLVIFLLLVSSGHAHDAFETAPASRRSAATESSSETAGLENTWKKGWKNAQQSETRTEDLRGEWSGSCSKRKAKEKIVFGPLTDDHFLNSEPATDRLSLRRTSTGYTVEQSDDPDDSAHESTNAFVFDAQEKSWGYKKQTSKNYSQSLSSRFLSDEQGRLVMLTLYEKKTYQHPARMHGFRSLCIMRRDR